MITKPFTRPVDIPKNKLLLPHVAEDLVLADSRSYHELDSLNKNTLGSKFDQILNDFKALKCGDIYTLEHEVSKLLKFIKSK